MASFTLQESGSRTQMPYKEISYADVRIIHAGNCAIATDHTITTDHKQINHDMLCSAAYSRAYNGACNEAYLFNSAAV